MQHSSAARRIRPDPAERPERQGTLRALLHEIIFEADTREGKAFDVALLVAIVTSVAVVMLDSVGVVRARFHTVLYVAEWFFTLLFTAEYVVRLWSVRRPLRYATSFFGVIDLVSIVPTYLSLFVAGTEALLVVRILRMLRVFRILKMGQFLLEAHVLMAALRASGRKITVFLGAVLSLVVIMGTLMYLVEGELAGFTSIPRSMYWAIVTLTTVGYGDITPQTDLGRAIAALVMIAGYAIIAVPTGIVSVELANASRVSLSTRACPDCGDAGHDLDAVYCKRCGAKL